MTRNQRKTARAERMTRLLRALRTESAGACLSTEELADTTGLGDTVLPLLAALERRGWLEHAWVAREGGPLLHYRITTAGAEALAADDGGLAS